MSWTAWSYLAWGLWMLAFLALEFTGLARVSPWRTLSETCWSLEGVPVVRILFLAGMCVLTAHIVFKFPS